MKINNIHNSNILFKSLRTDKKKVEQLKSGEKPIIENNKQNIFAALNNISNEPERKNIEFLLDIANNLTYGQDGDSEFKTVLDNEGITPSERENTHWNEILKDTINKALSSSKDNVGDLQQEADRIFSTKKPLTNEQKELLNKRKVLTEMIVNTNSISDSETLSTVTNIRENLDYFIASSEISYSQKNYCLDKFQYLLSDDYKIEPQLEDKKLNVFDELLSDLLIQTPKQDILTIKGVDQLYSGICAAISICRKAIAYEDKSLYTDLVLKELDNNNTMNVYDITELGSGKEVSIPKAKVDYETAQRKGYRILDAASHIWMQNAKTSGDGTIDLISYTPFDDYNYGIFDDSFWYDNYEEDNQNEIDLLRTLIKEDNFIKSAQKTKKFVNSSYSKLQEVKKSSFLEQEKSTKKIQSILSDIFPEKTKTDLSIEVKSLQNFYNNKTTNGNEVNISEQMPKELKKQLLEEQIISNNPKMNENQKSKLKEKSDLILAMITLNSNAEKNISNINKYHTFKSKYSYNKNLYLAAAAHRIAVENDIQLPGNEILYEKKLNLSPKDIQFANYLKSYAKSIQNGKLLSEKTQEEKEEITKDIYKDLNKFQVIIPQKLDEISKNITDETIAENLSDIYSYYINTISEGNTEKLEEIKTLFPPKTDKTKILEQFKKQEKMLKNSPSNEDVLKSLQFLGFNSPLQILYLIINSYQNGIPQEDYGKLLSKYGNVENIQKVFNENVEEFNNLNRQNTELYNKWGFPETSEIILKEAEKQKQVISEQDLNTLKTKFNEIDKGRAKNSKISDTKQRNKADSEIMKFSKSEKEILNSIDKSLGQMKKFCKTKSKFLNKKLADNLDYKYSQIGMLNGQFYVPQEGSSGLYSQNIMRIYEQITGKPCYIQPYLLQATETIKEGNGSGILTMSVDDKDYAYHAQYAPSVTSETFENPITKEKTKEDVIWMDNTWGQAEREKYWNNRNGFLYTDYARNFGLKNGFITTPDYKTGLPVKYLNHAQGHYIDKNNNEETNFAVFSDMVLQGESLRTNQKIYDLLSSIMKIDEYAKTYDKLEEQLASGYKINIEEINGYDELSYNFSEKIIDRTQKEIAEKEDFEKLDKNDPLKFAYNKLAVYLSTENKEFRNFVAETSNYEELEEIQEEIFEAYKEDVMAIVGKSDKIFRLINAYSTFDLINLFDDLNTKFNAELSEEEQNELISAIFAEDEDLQKTKGTIQNIQTFIFENIKNTTPEFIQNKEAADYFIEESQKIIEKQIKENIQITSLDSSALKKNVSSKNLIEAIDKYLEPKSDEELLTILKTLQNSDIKNTRQFFDKLTEKDVGVELRDPYEYVVKVKDYNSSVVNALTECSGYEIISQNINSSKRDEDYTPEELYRVINNKLTNLDIQKYISKFKDEALRRYKVRPAFPDPVIVSDDAIVEMVNNFFSDIDAYTKNINNQAVLINVLMFADKLYDDLDSNKVFTSLMNGENVNKTEDNEKEINEIINKFANLSEIISSDTSDNNDYNRIINATEYLINILKSNKEINAKEVKETINNILKYINEYNSSIGNLETDSLIEYNQKLMQSLKLSVKNTIEVNILESQRNDAYQKIKEIIKLSINGNDEKLAEKQEEFKEFTIKNFIMKDPCAILKQTIELIQDGKKDTEQYEFLRNYLMIAINEAATTDIQYKLIKNQHEGMGSKIKSILPAFTVSANGKYDTLDSDWGMIYLVKTLSNLNDNNKTLQLLLNQSGLTEKAFNAFANNFNLEKSVEFADENTELTRKNIKDIQYSKSIIEKFMKQNNKSYNNSAQAIEALKEFYERHYKHSKDSGIYIITDSIIKQTAEEEKNNNSSNGSVSEILYAVSNNIIEYYSQILMQNITSIQQQNKAIEDYMKILSSFNILTDSPEEEKLNELIENFYSTREYLNQTIQKLAEEINTLDFIEVYSKSV